MAEHVTKEQIIDWFRPYGHLDEPIPFETLVSDLRVMKSADVAPVQHGRWKCHGDCGVTECSVCGWSIEEYAGDYAYCPSCGAKMDGGAD